jgi:hypothetical protein
MRKVLLLPADTGKIDRKASEEGWREWEFSSRFRNFQSFAFEIFSFVVRWSAREEENFGEIFCYT